MAARTYVPGLRLVVKYAKRYIERWQTKLEASLTPAQYTCVTALLSALTECILALGEEAINP